MQSDVRTSTKDVFVFYALACALTWLLATPLALAWIRHLPPPPYAITCAGLSAFGPLFATLAVAGPQKRLRDVFSRWRTNPAWVVLALFAPMAIHVVATAISAAAGGKPTTWLHPPSTPEQIAALIVFPIGEEFGWRGFAYPRMARRYGLVKGSLALGVFWGLWHLMYSVTPDAGRFDAFTFVMTMIELPLYSVLVAWVFERANRSMAVAIAFHAGAHLDHIELAPHNELRLHAMHILVVAALAIVAGRSLSKRADG